MPVNDPEELATAPRAAPGEAADARAVLAAASLEDMVTEILKRLGEDPEREGLRRTPERVAKSLAFLTKGYGETPARAVSGGAFASETDGMVIVRDIEIYSLCEHHLLPFYGKAHLAYIPNRRMLGLSKLVRLAEVYTRRLQVQERLTQEIADAVVESVEPHGVGVVVEAYHLCMMMRGVQKQGSKTVTSAMRGAFLEDQRTRNEFMELVAGGAALR